MLRQKRDSETHLKRDEGLDGTALDSDAGGHDFDDAPVQHFVTLWQTCDRHKLNLEDDITTSVLDHSIFNLELIVMFVAATSQVVKNVRLCLEING